MQAEKSRVLIIEDNPTDIAKLVLKINKFSDDITFTNTAERGLALFKGALMMDEPFNLLLTDILLPGLSGKELIEEIREVESNFPNYRIKIIAMSADKPERHVLEACRLGAGCYLEKPLTTEKLQEALKNADMLPDA